MYTYPQATIGIAPTICWTLRCTPFQPSYQSNHWYSILSRYLVSRHEFSFSGSVRILLCAEGLYPGFCEVSKIMIPCAVWFGKLPSVEMESVEMIRIDSQDK